MFNSLLKISSIESGGSSSSFTSIDYSRICHDVIDLLSPAADDKSMSLNLQLKDSLIVQGDRNLLFHAMANIIDNAIKFTRPNGKIAISLKCSRESILFSVSDEGPGIPSEKRSNVFRRFYRLEGHRGTEGCGLGLSLVSAVVKLHQGTIGLKNEENGLKFVVALSQTSNSEIKEIN